MSSYEDSSDMRCRFCHSNTIFMDYAQGDAVCTTCGVVNAERLPYCGAEWRDYSAINDDQDKKYVARAGSIVDESRWNGGLEPTCLGPVYGGYSGEAERYRKSLNKIKRVVDKWTDREFERKVEESRLAIKIKEEKKSKEKDENEDDEEENDWTQLGTNEHEQIARQRMEDLQSSHKILISEKWSLDRALLLHGSSNEIPNIQHIFDETPRDIEEERETLLKRMDPSQRKASSDLYEIYSLARCALGVLGLAENIGFMSEVMDAVRKYANLKGSFTVRGVSNKLQATQNSKNYDADHQRNLNKLRQMGSLVSAFIYLLCKKNGLWRNLSEICDSIQHPHLSDSNEAFIKAKHCSRAISDIRTLMPDFVQAITIASAKPSVEIESATNQSRHVIVTTNMVGHSLKNLNLSDIALAAVTNIAIHADEYTTDDVDVKPSVLIAAITYLVCDAGSTMQRLASQAAAAASMNMENASSLLKKNDCNENGKRKHIRPGGGGGGGNRYWKRRLGCSTLDKTLKIGHESEEITGDNTSTNDKNPNSVTPEPESFDALLQPIQQTPGSTSSDYPPSWYEWNREKPWGRSMKDIETCCKVTSTAARSCYKTQIYPKRKELLEMLQRSFPHNTTIGNCKVDIMLSNITVASSLMNSVPR